METTVVPIHSALENGSSNAKFEKPDLFEAVDYRIFLREQVAYLRSKGEYSVRKFAARAGLKSPSYLKKVMDGKKNLLLSTARRVGQALSLNPVETNLFVRLVAFNQAETDEVRLETARQLHRFKQFQKVRRLDVSHQDIYSSVIPVILIESLKTALASRSTEEIAEALGTSATEIKNAFRILEAQGLVQKTSQGYKQVDSTRETPVELPNAVTRKFHREMLEKALRALDGQPAETRQFLGLTLSMDSKRYDELKLRIYEFFKELNAEIENDTPPDRIYQISLQLFALAKV